MKLGIITFHCAHNYGALLQCYALQEYLKSLGHDVSVIDYRPWYLVKGYLRNSYMYWLSRNPKLVVRKFLYELKVHKTRARRYDKFDNFINTKLHLAPYYHDMDFSEYDAIFIGSDQVWDKAICGGAFDSVYFGENATCAIIPYAASNKMSSLTEEDSSFFKAHLAHFTAIGVREKKLQELLQPLTNKKITHTVDPTLLAGSLLTDSIKDERLVEDKYVLVYEVVEHPEVIHRTREYAELHGYKVVVLGAYLQTTDCEIRDQEASPSDFVNYIRHAECVFTTSFHGTALSIILRRKFYSFRQGNNSDLRIESLLNIAGLQDRFIDLTANAGDTDVDYSHAQENLERCINSSRTFIDDALNSIII